ncbi:hypothetical protein KY285_015983 [Solanum tuberosum]|nr:hypothetical protein KY289_016184 [Solanum tuberosum]KAH0701705.1 hypothetical protein KY285_015983 [Solanum tuberosum]
MVHLYFCYGSWTTIEVEEDNVNETICLFCILILAVLLMFLAVDVSYILLVVPDVGSVTPSPIGSRRSSDYCNNEDQVSAN